MSLKRFIDANSIANEIRLERQVRRVASLVVEGSDDRKVYGMLFDRRRCSIVAAYGKERVIEVVSLLENDGFQGILGLIDKDFDEITGVEYASRNVVVTDEHDMECMILRSDALSRVLIDAADEIKLLQFEARMGAVREILLERGRVVGCARLVSLRSNLNLDFDELQFRFINHESLELDLDRLVEILVSRNPHCVVTRPTLREMIQHEVGQGHDAWQICCGHDVVSILAIALRRCVGNARGNEAGPSILASKLRLAYRVEDFTATGMCLAIQEWENRHPEFAFLL